MKSSHLYAFIFTLLFAALMMPSVSAAQADFPRLQAVSPDTGKPGDLLTVTGQNLGKDRVKELYLTDGKTDWKTTIVEQSATAIKFKIPANAKDGRFDLMVLTRGPNPSLIEQPVKVTVKTGTS